MSNTNIVSVEVNKDGLASTLKDAGCFFNKDAMTVCLADFCDDVRNTVLPSDMTVAKNRKVVRSFAATIAKVKTAIDAEGKDITKDIKAKIKVVDEARKLLRDTLDALKDEVRKPLTDFEAEEKRQKQADELAEQEEQFAINQLEQEILAEQQAESNTVELPVAKPVIEQPPAPTQEITDTDLLHTFTVLTGAGMPDKWAEMVIELARENKAGYLVLRK